MSMYQTAPVSMVLDALSNNYTENSYGAYTIPAEILTDRDKQKIIRDTFEAVVTGNASAADNLHRIVLFRAINGNALRPCQIHNF